jgi:hypothetical protein
LIEKQGSYFDCDHSRDRKINELIDAVNALQCNKESPTKSPNSDYAAALRIVREYHTLLATGHSVDKISFENWVEQRLNASTHIA